MKTIAWMLTRMILIRFLAILLAITLFVLTLEIVSYAKEILALEKDSLVIIAKYALMRAPAMLSTFLSMSLLLAMLLTLTELSYRNELTAIWAAGVSPLRLVVMLLPLALFAGGLHFLLNDQAGPRTAPVLRDWGIGDYGEKRIKVGEKDPIWMRAGNDILRAAGSNADSTELEDVVIFRRDNSGILHEQIFAANAKLVAGRWDLSRVIVYYRTNLPPNQLDHLVYSGAMKPAAAGARSGDPEEMTLSDLSYFVSNSGFGIRPVWVYETWWHKRLTPFLTTIAMIALCIPLASHFRRGGGIGVLFAVGVALGFLFFVIDGIALSIGELGFVSPWLAAWMPTLVFGALAFALSLRAERV
jgi:lipopolysaccharide export system permease protein